jgi:hypothetical protein
MPTTNLIAAANVEGNISSCTTNVSIINGSSRPNLWIIEDVGYATNNGTGKVDVYHSWQLSDFSTGLCIIVGYDCYGQRNINVKEAFGTFPCPVINH